MIRFRTRGDLKKTKRFLRNLDKKDWRLLLERYAQEGVIALQSNTPKDTGETAHSWYYDIKKHRGGITISWKNSNVVNGVNIAIILQYGHGTRNGGYVEGIDYINPAIRPVFVDMVRDIWEEVQNARW